MTLPTIHCTSALVMAAIRQLSECFPLGSGEWQMRAQPDTICLEGARPGGPPTLSCRSSWPATPDQPPQDWTATAPARAWIDLGRYLIAQHPPTVALLRLPDGRAGVMVGDTPVALDAIPPEALAGV